MSCWWRHFCGCFWCPCHIMYRSSKQEKKKKSFPSRDFVDNICMVKTDVEGHDLVILRCFSVAYQGRVFTKKTVWRIFYFILNTVNFYFSTWRISHTGIWSLGFDPKYFGWSGGETLYWRLTNTKVISILSANFSNLAVILIIFQRTAAVFTKSSGKVSQIFSSRRRVYWGYEGTLLCWRRARLWDLQVRTRELFMLQARNYLWCLQHAKSGRLLRYISANFLGFSAKF